MALLDVPVLPVGEVRPALNLRAIFYIVGAFQLGLGVAMLVPAAVDAAGSDPDWVVFLASALVAGFIGAMLVFANRGQQIRLNIREAFLLTTLTWVTIAAVAALPLIFSRTGLSYTDAYFEVVSGLTTTGSTVITDLDRQPLGILLWRAMLQGMGGAGIIVMALAVLPFLRVGGMNLFRTESSDRSEKVMPRPAQVATGTFVVYVVLIVLCALAYYAAGMSAFDAITHAMPTLATGGFANYDNSFAHFQSPTIEWLAIAFMILGSMPLVVFIRLSRGDFRALRNSQIRVLVAFVAAVSLAMAAWHSATNDVPFSTALRDAAFSVTTVVSTTGFATADYSAWGGFAVAVFFLLMLVGGCNGSTTGGIKIFRFQVMWVILKSQLNRLVYPSGVFPERYDDKPLPPDIPRAVLSFVFVYLISIAIFSLILLGLGLDLVTSVSTAASAVGNVGPGLGPVVGPAGNFSSLPDAAKWVLSLAMLLGRLELFTVLVLLMPSFWRK
jgi:trk system potassium uptake protein TrkH